MFLEAICMKRVASPGSMHDTGCLGLVHWDDPEGWNGEGGGRRVQGGEWWRVILLGGREAQCKLSLRLSRLCSFLKTSTWRDPWGGRQIMGAPSHAAAKCKMTGLDLLWFMTRMLTERQDQSLWFKPFILLKPGLENFEH